MILKAQDSGRIINMNVGDTFFVHLQENPTTGYRWTVDSTHGMKELENQLKLGEAVGAAGTRLFQFQTTGVGSYVLRMKYYRQWEEQDSAIDCFHVEIVVK
ncbi:protease inhibitor I42 family protein [Priestia megaterium]|uniref:protease inhibitor I42 family protein n=1 Tax=Priestia megaterium TaxID=1404 RepID=UPI0039F6916C